MFGNKKICLQFICIAFIALHSLHCIVRTKKVRRRTQQQQCTALYSNKKLISGQCTALALLLKD